MANYCQHGICSRNISRQSDLLHASQPLYMYMQVNIALIMDMNCKRCLKQCIVITIHRAIAHRDKHVNGVHKKSGMPCRKDHLWCTLHFMTKRFPLWYWELITNQWVYSTSNKGNNITIRHRLFSTEVPIVKITRPRHLFQKSLYQQILLQFKSSVLWLAWLLRYSIRFTEKWPEWYPENGIFIAYCYTKPKV